MARIAAPAAWDTSRGLRSDGTPVKIAVLDCGIYDEASGYPAPDGGAGHPDLRGKVVARQNFTLTADADDYCNHGTHIAGIAAARTNDGLGVAGVGYEAKLLNGKVLDDTAVGTTTWISQGISWAAQSGADVINMSLAGVGACPANVQQAVNDAWAAGAVLVAAAGNEGQAGASWPANCDNVVAVAATDLLDQKAGFSNYGAGVDAAAPGVDVLSLDYTGGYWGFSGTSQASAHVAGLAALVWASAHGTSADAVVRRLTETADRTGAEGTHWQYGRVNAATAVGTLLPPAPTSPLAPIGLTATALAGRQIRLTWTDRSGNETGFRIERRRDSGSWSQIATVGRDATTYTNSGLVAGARYTYRVRAYNSVGNSSWATSSQVTARR
jgi:thermitase